ncbi:MAG: ribosome small subunit-dependent GTPase A, partial [Clostridia bacterium]|nr:ribosome small subunit-dependent GTPase A [Clostridia bacterium]
MTERRRPDDGDTGWVTRVFNRSLCEVWRGGERYTCRVRGRLRAEGGPVAGDRVRFRVTGPGEGVVEEVLPRRVLLVRPAVANVDQVLVVTTWCEPPLNRQLLDRILVLAEARELGTVLAWNKVDLVGQRERPALDAVAEVYRRAGYPVLFTSALTGEGIDGLKEQLAGHVTVLAGLSGVGKSSLLNALFPGLARRTGTLSPKGERGRHTTRQAELLPLAQGWVVDTPGFSRLDLDEVDERMLPYLFPDLVAAGSCRLPDCRHRVEPGCAVRE